MNREQNKLYYKLNSANAAQQGKAAKENDISDMSNNNNSNNHNDYKVEAVVETKKKSLIGYWEQIAPKEGGLETVFVPKENLKDEEVDQYEQHFQQPIQKTATKKLTPKDLDKYPFRGVSICQYCRYAPCLMDFEAYDHYDNISADAEAMHDDGMPNNEIHYHCYSYMVKVMWGWLGRGQRKKLPICITAEIHDLAPADNLDYIGFQDVELEE